MTGRIEARMAALEAELEMLKREMVDEHRPAGPLMSDRRGMVKLLAAGAVGAVTGAAVLTAKPASAADNDPMVLGITNMATSFTGITASVDSALVVDGGTSGVGIIANGFLGNAWFVAGGPSPVHSPGLPGIVWVDENGDWWGATIDAPTGDGGWRKLAGPSTAGQLHILPAPVRVYDSRPGLPPNVAPQQPTVGNGIRSIDTTLNGASGVPTSANAVLITLTVTGPTTAGFAAVWPSGAWPGTSNINFAAGQSIATTTVSGCSSLASIQVLSNTVTDFLVDVIGFYQ